MITSTPRYSRLAVIAAFAVGLIACGQPDGSAFCEQAEFFASRSVRDTDHHHAEDRSTAAYLDALVRLRDLAPVNLRTDLDVLVTYEQNYDLARGGQTPRVEVTGAGERVGSAIELRCDLQIPEVR